MENTTLDLPPFAINKAFTGRRFRTKEHKEWVEAGLWLLKKHKKYKGKVGIEIVFYQDSRQDIDSGIKIFLDLLVKAEIITDDRYVDELYVRKEVSKKKKIEFLIYEL